MNRTVHNYTTKEGLNVEYTIVGQGEPVLIMHGGHSNCNEVLGYRELTERGYSIITPSRPGYGRTSKELGENLCDACEAYMELLDNLRIPQVHLIAISAGGPSGIHFAAQYPQRVRSLILQAAVSHTWLTPADKLYQSAQLMFRPSTEQYLWAAIRVMNQWFPRLLFKSMIPSFSTRLSKEVLQQISEDDLQLFKQMANAQRSGSGFLIDLEHARHDRNSVLSAIQCQTLIMHSIHDATVSVAHARHAYHYISNAQLCELEVWGHLIWLGEGAREMYERLFSFMEEQA
ncbi:alpha/beta fold hydrolase [Paenibacillus mendelii]|uniref:Alpha/beta fold hydrolase n=1 Tax=Paenibacillus mendelii TaxID=206163 RepID=A0ABV6J256_9BACL|nr:alpha/beta hydrolase [Paenibacillus mendelii]MCQ6560561.1 alpha/beta hydrolase [Paenibacillus mendelii]